MAKAKIKKKAKAKPVVKNKSPKRKVKVIAKPKKKAMRKPAPKKTVKVQAKAPTVKKINKPLKSKTIKPTLKIVKKTTPSTSSQEKYGEKDLQEFKKIILNKLADSKGELANLTAMLNHSGDHGTDDTASTFKVLEDGSDSFAKEEAAQLAARQKKFIEQLEAALVRIENKTYGICRVTGKLIPKERLRAVPHTTQSMEAKLKQNSN